MQTNRISNLSSFLTRNVVDRKATSRTAACKCLVVFEDATAIDKTLLLWRASALILDLLFEGGHGLGRVYSY